MATLATGKTWVSGDEVTPGLLNQMVNSATISGIVNADIASAADIAGSKLADGGVTAAKLASTLDLTGKTVTLPNASVTPAMLTANMWSAIAPVGAVLQVKHVVAASRVAVSGAGTIDLSLTPQYGTGTQILSLAITPSSSSSKIVLRFNAMIGFSTNTNVYAALFRNTVANAVASSALQFSSDFNILSFQHVDSPATTSEVTYTVYIRAQNDVGIGGTFSSNRLGNTALPVLIAEEIKG